MKLEKKEKRKAIITYIIIAVIGIALAIIVMLIPDEVKEAEVETPAEIIEEQVNNEIAAPVNNNGNEAAPTQEAPANNNQQNTAAPADDPNAIHGFEARGAQVRCKLCGKEVYDGWDRGSNFNSIVVLLARHLNEEHGYNIDIDYINPNNYPEYTENGNPEDTVKAIQEYTDRINKANDVASNFEVVDSGLEMRETTYYQ